MHVVLSRAPSCSRVSQAAGSAPGSRVADPGKPGARGANADAGVGGGGRLPAACRRAGGMTPGGKPPVLERSGTAELLPEGDSYRGSGAGDKARRDTVACQGDGVTHTTQFPALHKFDKHITTERSP